MSGPKSVKYQPSPAELARREEERALRQAASRFRVLSADLEALRLVAADTEAAFAVTIAIPAKSELHANSAAEAEAKSADLERALTETRQRIHSAQRNSESERLHSYLSTLVELDVPSGQPTAKLAVSSAIASERETQESLLFRAERYLASLSPDAVVSEHVIHLAAAVTLATPELASLAIRDLQAEIGRINREAKRHAAIADRLRQLDVRAGSLGGPELLREVLFLRGEPGGATEEGLTALEGRIHDEEQRAATSQSRNEARAAMERALIAEGYEVLDGFDTAVPHDGVLVRKPGLDYHAWRVSVGDESIHMDVVRTALETDPGITTIRDVEAETRMCADLPAVLSRVAETGVEVGRVRRLAPGDVPVKALPNATSAYRSPASAQAPKERSL